MREKLKELIGKKIKIYATFERFGKRTDYKGNPKKTILLRDLKDYRYKELTDHIWFDCGKKFEKLKLKEGDQIRLFATITTYSKGYISDENPFSQIDYKLIYPSQAVIVKRSPKN